MNKYIRLGCLCAVLITQGIYADSTSEENTSHYFDTIKHDPAELSVFLKTMPKGGDLHNHRSGAAYTENLLDYAKNKQYCVDPKTLSVSLNPNCAKVNTLSNYKDNWILKNQLINAWSMRHYNISTDTAHDHFFKIFYKFLPITTTHRSQTLTEITERAGEQNEIYLETMITTDNDKEIPLGDKFNKVSYEQTYQALQQNGIQNIVDDINQQIANEQKYMKKSLACGTTQAKAGCHVTQRYQYTALRTLPANEIFPQLVAGFMLANQNPLVVGVNIVGAEDDRYTLEQYQQQMEMFAFLHKKFPNVKISIHAGELKPGLVPPKYLNNHIAGAVNIAQANRIGHGVDIPYENNAKQTIKTMADQKIAVEINLSSNAEILGVEGKQHPFMYYLKHNVPVVLSTDDEGILRTDLTREYQRAVETYHLSYPTLKNLARNSITYSFLDGDSLWANASTLTPVAACKGDKIGIKTPSTTCKNFLDKNPKAKLQWHLEHQFGQFEQQYN